MLDVLLGKTKSEEALVGELRTLSKEQVDKLYGLARRMNVKGSKVHNLNISDALVKVSERAKEEE